MTALLARLDPFDLRVERIANRIRGKRLIDRYFYLASALGDHGMAWGLVAAIQLLVDRDRAFAAGRLIVALIIESILVNAGIKSLFRRRRPVFEGDRPLHLRRPRTSSFPSGHSTSAFMAMLLASEGQAQLLPLYLVMALSIAYSRIHVRIHHGSDVVAGALLGLLFGVAVRFAVPL